MSKSEGNFATVSDLTRKGYSPESIRFALVSSNYRNHLNFTEELLEESQKNIDKVSNLIQGLSEVVGKGMNFDGKKYKDEFLEALCDDLNTPKALTALYELVKFANSNLDKLSKENAEEILAVLQYMNEVLAVFSFEKKVLEIPKNVQKLVAEREKARKEKDFAKSDELRDTIAKEGYRVLDSKDGVKIEKI